MKSSNKSTNSQRKLIIENILIKMSYSNPYRLCGVRAVLQSDGGSFADVNNCEGIKCQELITNRLKLIGSNT